MKKLSVSQFLLRRNILVVLLMLMIAIMVICISSIKHTNSERIAQANNLLTAHQESADNAFHLVSNVVYQTSHEQFFYEYLISNNDIDFYTLQVQKSLSQKLSSTESYCYSVGVVKGNADFVISTRRSTNLNSYLSDIHISRDSFENFKNTAPYYMVNDDYVYIPGNSDASPYITFGHKLYTVGNKVSYVMISFYKEFFVAPSTENDCYFLFHNYDAIAKTNPLYSDAIVDAIKKLPGSMDMADKTFQHKDGAYIHLIRPSKTLSATRYAYTLKLPFINRFGSTLLIILIILLIAYTALIIKRTTNMTVPIDHTVDALRQFYTTPDEDKPDLSMLAQAADNVVRENITLNSIINTQEQLFRSRFISDVMLGVLLPQELEAGIEKYGINYANEKITIAILDFLYYESSNIDISCENLRDLLSGILAQHDIQSVLGDIALFNTKYIIIFRDTKKDMIITVLDKLLQLIKEQHSIILLAAISTQAESISDWKDSFNISLKLLEHKYTFSGRRILMPEHLAQLNENNLYYPLDVEQFLITNTIKIDRTKVHLIISELMSKNFSGGKITEEHLLEFNQAMAYTTNRCLQRINAPIDEVFEQGAVIYLELKMCQTETELKEKLFMLFDTLMNYISQNAPKSCRLTAEAFSKYIAQNYQQDISLDDVADYFELSAPHTSKTIKALTGQTFKEYLNTYRIGIAKQIFLDNTNLKIKQVAQKVGFSNVNTFIRVFKSLEGVSPGSFKKKDS